MSFATFAFEQPHPHFVLRSPAAAQQLPRSCAVESRRPSSIWARHDHDHDHDHGSDMFRDDASSFPLSLLTPFEVHQLHARVRAQREWQAAQQRQRAAAAAQLRARQQEAHAARVYRQRLIERELALEHQRQQRIQEERVRRARVATALLQNELQARRRAARARLDLAALFAAQHQQRQQHDHGLTDRDPESEEAADAAGGAAHEESPAASSASTTEPAQNVTASRLYRRMHSNGQVEEVYVRQVGDKIETVRRNYNPRTLSWETVAPSADEASPQLPQVAAAAAAAAADGQDDDSKSDAGSTASASSTENAFLKLGSLFSEPATPAAAGAAAAAAAGSRPRTPELDLTGDSDPSPSTVALGSPQPLERSQTPSSLVEIRDVPLSGHDSDSEDEDEDAGDWHQL